ncbi:hypothetical protein DYB28_002287 [Aphanomyces astaci]|uniref:Uncharacterized protein n=2 Tax=Aphanomyces astaci TaxID=112090 RepID=A0A9X8E6Q5_APHAT|nr:hypothetical protein DYB28_002287 [Aphanomyces astaci]
MMTMDAPRRNLSLSYSVLHAADVNGDSSVTSKEEIHSMDLARQLADSPPPSAPPLRPSAVPSSTSSKDRYAPWLKKALGKMHHAEALWHTHRPPSATSVGANSLSPAPPHPHNKSLGHQGNPARPLPPPPSSSSSFVQQPATIWTAVHAGNVADVRRFLDLDKHIVFRHHEADGGKTLLQVACWHGHGDVNAKLKILQLLVQFGAVVEHQDSHGDNALHWSARMQALPTTRFLIQDTDAAVYALISENHKRQKPLDVAKLARDAKPSMVTSAIFDLLRRVHRDCNVRLKIQYGKKLRLHAEAEARARRVDDVTHAADTARMLCHSADQVWAMALEAAECVRNDMEAKVLDEGGKDAVGRARVWLETKEGKAWVKKEAPDAIEAIKSLVHKGVVPKPRDLKKAAAVRVMEEYVLGQETNMRDLIKKKFGREHPAFESRDVEYYKRVVHNGGAS